MDSETPEMFISKLKHDINCLSDTDRSIRKSGLDKLSKEITSGKSSKESIELLLSNFLMNPLVKCLEDQIERHREATIKLYSWLVNEIQFDKTLISVLIDQIISRIDKAPFAEKSEELRLKLIDLLSQILHKYTDEIRAHIPSMTKMIAALLNDPCPEIKMKLSSFISEMSILLKEHIGNHSKPILLSLCANLKHQHKKAIADLLICNNVGTFIDECIPFLKPLIVDNHDDLRRSFYVSIAKLLNNLNIVYLKKSESLLVLLLLNGLSDDKEDIRKLTSSLIEESGENRRKLAIETGEDIAKYI